MFGPEGKHLSPVLCFFGHHADMYWATTYCTFLDPVLLRIVWGIAGSIPNAVFLRYTIAARGSFLYLNRPVQGVDLLGSPTVSLDTELGEDPVTVGGVYEN